MRHDDSPASSRPSVGVVGGGLAGLSAACALLEHGLHVELFESRSELGGRAASVVEPRTGQEIDFSQHVAMGCCTNWLDLFRRAGVDGFLGRPTGDYTFFAPDGRPYRFAAWPWLPAPLHLLPAVARLGYLSAADRGGLARAMARLFGGAAKQEAQTAAAWLGKQRQSQAAIDLFWNPLIVSALGEAAQRVSLAAMRKVLLDGFLSSATAYRLIVPTRPLGRAFDGIERHLLANGAIVWRSSEVCRVELGPKRGATIVSGDGDRTDFDFVVVAVPWHRVEGLLDEPSRRAVPRLELLRRIEPAPITAVHLWFRREIVTPPQAMLLGRTSQWLFNLAARRGTSPAGPWPCQVVISASRALLDVADEEIVARVCRELASIWPGASVEHLVASSVLTHRQAVFSMSPGVELLRPGQETAADSLLLAGDWTATGWPATMEGAVRSGRLAAEAILRRVGRAAKVLTPDLPRSPLVRLLS